jgi:hypothetical protein
MLTLGYFLYKTNQKYQIPQHGKQTYFERAKAGGGLAPGLQRQ